MSKKVFFTAEIGINHNGDMDIAKKLIDTAVIAGCDAVKFQKRTVDKVYTKEFLDSPRQSPWGNTQRQQKEGLEFNADQYSEIDEYCKQKGISWFASAWDVDSQIFLRQFNLKYNKIASAMLGNTELLETVASELRYTFISTGMSTLDEIDSVVNIFRKYNCPFELVHCNSTYPTPIENSNLNVINTLRNRYGGGHKVGFSGHETGYIATLGAVAMGVSSVERHITLDKNMYGSDQKVSLEPQELIQLLKNIRLMEKALGNGKKEITPEEMIIRKKLRG